MKKIIILMLLVSSIVNSQTPSINQTISKSNSLNYMIKSEGERINNNIKKLRNERDVLSKATNKSEDTITSKIVEIDNKIDKEISKILDGVKFEVVNYIDYYVKELELKKVEINDLINEQTTYSKARDTANMQIVSKKIGEKYKQIEQLEKDRKIKVKEHSYKWFLPSLKSMNRAYFFETMYNNDIKKTSFLNSFGISGNEYGIVGQSELLADNVSFLRLTFGTVISATKNDESIDSEEKTTIESLDRLINGGGNFYLDISLPFFTTIDRNGRDLLTSYNYFSIRAATDIKGFGNDIDTSTGNGSLGFYSYNSFASENKKFNFFLQGNINYTLGSKEFYKNLSIDHNNGFLNGKIIAGLTLDNKYRFTANFLTFGSEESLRREKIAVGIQLLP